MAPFSHLAPTQEHILKIADLLGFGGKKSRTIRDVEESLSKLASERETAHTAISATLRKRDDMLLTSSDSEIRSLDAELNRLRLALERLDKAEPALRQELAAKRTAAKSKQLTELSGRYLADSFKYRDRLREAVDAQADLLKLHDEIRRQGFEHESATLITPTRWCTRESLFEYDALLERSREAARPRPAAAPVAIALPAAKPAPAAPKAKAPASTIAAAAAPRPARPPFEAKADEAGNIQIRVLRGGIEVLGRGRRSGETIDLPFADGKRVVESGGAEFEGALQ
jgi:hypothetical protein